MLRLLVAAAVAGALLHIAKGAVLLAGGPDLSLVPPMLLLFGVGLFAYVQVLPARARRSARLGGALAGAAALAGAVACVYLALDIRPEDTGSPIGVRAAYIVGTFGILLALLALTIAALRSRALRRQWAHVAVAAAVLWFPLEGLTAVTPDGVGLLLAGVCWLLAAVAVLQRPARA